MNRQLGASYGKPDDAKICHVLRYMKLVACQVVAVSTFSIEQAHDRHVNHQMGNLGKVVVSVSVANFLPERMSVSLDDRRRKCRVKGSTFDTKAADVCEWQDVHVTL